MWMLLWTLFAALAYEVDPWTPRSAQLADATSEANQAFGQLLDRAIERVQRRCPDDVEQRRRRLARAIAQTTARRVRLPGRPGLSSLGHGVYSAWLEVAPGVERTTTGSAGLYSEVRLLDSPILRLAGTASTVRFGDVLLGSDKIDHFLATGFDYYRWSRWSVQPTRAVRRGVRTERLFYGRLTSNTFSYADLEANWSGYRFYAQLLTPQSTLQPDPIDCVVQVGGWDWGAWVARSWDEFYNPSVYGPRVRRAVEDYLGPEREGVCRSFEPQALSAPIVGRAPEQRGPFGLEDFCPSGSSSGTSADGGEEALD